MQSSSSLVAPQQNSTQYHAPNPALDKLLKKKQGETLFKEALSSQADGQKKVSFEKIHHQASSSNYADSSHSLNERKKNIEAQEILAKVRDVELEIKHSRKALKRAKKKGNENNIQSIRKALKSLSKKKEMLLNISITGIDEQNKNQKPVSHSTGSGQTTLRSGDLIGSENTKPSQTALHTTDSLKESSLLGLALMLDERLGNLDEAEERLSKLKNAHRPAEDIASEEKKIQFLRSEIKTLNTTLSIFVKDLPIDSNGETKSTTPSSQPVIDGSAPDKQETRELIRKVTTRRQRNKSGTKPLKRSENPARNSTLYTDDEVLNLLNTKGRQLTKGIHSNIDKATTEFERLMHDRSSLQQKIDGEEDSEDRKKLSEQLKLLDKKIVATSGKLNQILEKTETIEKTVRKKAPQLSEAEKEQHYIALTEKFKSENTKSLEKKYKALLADYVKQNASGTTTLTMLGGAIANLGTLSIGNGVTRTMTGFGASLAGVFCGAVVGGGLHAILTTAILKQVMRETWTSPILSEYNNYWKLVGASWGDWWRNEEKKAKYVSKDSSNPNLLTIKERLKEESFWELFQTRYKVEEMPYFSFMGNYMSKGLAGATLPHWALDKTSTAVADAAMHLPMGWISGAETSMLIQEQRSQLPKAKLVPLPSREIASAEAEYLAALLVDLQGGLQNLLHSKQLRPEDPNEREMLKAISRTSKALDSAKLRSKFLGTLRQEISAGFANLDATLDTLTEMISRTLVLLPSAGASYLLASWRASPDPLTAALGHIIPAILLILPPGWTMRPLTSGIIRAALQAIFNGRAPDVAAVQGVNIPDTLREDSPDDTELVDASDVTIHIHGNVGHDESSEVVGSASEGDVTDSDDEWHGQGKRDFVGF
jgi:hypothetical protein